MTKLTVQLTLGQATVVHRALKAQRDHLAAINKLRHATLAERQQYRADIEVLDSVLKEFA